MNTYAVRPSLSQQEQAGLDALSPTLAHLLFHRGITDTVRAESFLHPEYEAHTHDPFLMKDMSIAVKHILEAISKKEKICIYSDYDCDGIPGAVAFRDFFKLAGYDNVINYIPHRHDEGFGLHTEAIENIAKEKSKLMITLDCGIVDTAEVTHAKKLGLEVIITDHHLPGETLPEAIAILNPKQSGCEYPFKDLCGSGVIFKLIQALIQKGNFSIPTGKEKWLLDMIGVATCADMVPLVGENRVFAYYGLKVLRKSPRKGLQALFQKLKTNQAHLTEDDIGFTLGPRINVASRMGIPMDAFNLLSTEDDAEAQRLAEHLEAKNDERKGLVGSMVREIKKKITERGMEEAMHPVLVMGNPNWKPALLGLAANSLLEEHLRPVFLWGREGGDTIKGSCRSGGDISVVDLMRATEPGTFLDMGGHTCAGGFSVAHDKIHLLEGKLNEALQKIHTESKEVAPIAVDMSIPLEQVDWAFYSELEKLAPFGVGNPKPLFLFEHSTIIEASQFGKEKNHLKILFKGKNNKPISAIAFFASPTDYKASLQSGGQVTLIAHVEKSMFRNFPELRLKIIDIL